MPLRIRRAVALCLVLVVLVIGATLRRQPHILVPVQAVRVDHVTQEVKVNQEVVGQGAILLYVLAGALGGGATVLVAFGLAVRFVLNSPVLVAALENLAKSLPPEVITILRDTGKLVAEVTDDVPVADKMTAPPQVR